MHKAFAVHMLNDTGKALAQRLAQAFDDHLKLVYDLVGGSEQSPREMALVATHLELASFYAKKAMAQQPGNQVPVGQQDLSKDS